MNLDELQSVQNRERQASDLQNLRPTFYEDAARFVRELRAQRQRVVREDGLDSREFERLSNDIETAERAVESVYERRVGKVVKKASIAAADMPTEDDGLTAEEQDLFETLVEDIRANRERVLSTLETEEDTEAVTGGPAGTESPGEASESEADRRTHREESDPRPDPEESDPLLEPESKTEPGTSTGEETTGSDIERATVRITEDVGEILGVDQRAYHLTREDVVTLPVANAGPLVEQGAAKRID